MQKNLNDYTDTELLQIANDSTSFYNFLLKLGFVSNGSTDYVFYRKYFKNRNLNLIFNGQKENDVLNFDDNGRILRRYDNAEMFVKHSLVSRKTVKDRVIKDNLITYKCKECGNIGEWNGKKLVLQLEHKNGVRDDNRIENLCFLCPNCHSQTSTFSSKNLVYRRQCICGKTKHKESLFCAKCTNTKKKEVGKTKLPKLETLTQEIQNLGYVQVGRKYGVSDNAVRKWIKSYGLDPKTIKNAL